MKFLLLSLCLLGCIDIAYSQSGIKGRITDQSNLAVPFAVVYDETSLTGITANADGYFEIRLEDGLHSLVIKAMGYHQIRKTITVNGKFTVVDFVMQEQPMAIKEVVITPGKEDPAYAMMRKVIGLAPYHLNQVNKYTAEVYLRGTVQVEKMPKFIAKHTEVEDDNGVTYKLKSGDVYMTESLNKIEFEAPDKYRQTVLSIHTTFPGSDNNMDPMDIINASLYEPKIAEFISPLAPNAFHFYKYTYEGFFDEGKTAIFKIKVTPKRNSQQLVSGYLFIVDQLWCLHSADLSAEMFFGKLDFKAIYSPVKSDAWLPVSYQFFVNASIMGVKANYRYNSSVKFMHVELNGRNESINRQIVQEPQEKDDEVVKKTKNQLAIDDIMKKDDLTNRDMMKLAAMMAKETSKDTTEKSLEIKQENNKAVTFEKDAVKKDTGYWNAIRPIPLTKIETITPEMHMDSVSTKRSVNDTTSKADTGTFKRNLNKIAEFATTGAGFNLFGKALHVHYDGLIGIKKFDFNTVDGFIFRQTLTMNLKTDSMHTLKIKPGAAYGFSRQQLMWWTDVGYEYAPLHNGNLHFYIGSRSADYNNESGINSTVNSLASLFFRRNYMKLFQENQIRLENSIDIANGLTMQLGAGYRTSRELKNQTDFSFFYRNERNYSPNSLPDIPPGIITKQHYEEAFWEFKLQFTPKHYYKISGGKKVYQHSDYPTFYLTNRMAVPGIVKSAADYDLLEIGAKQKIEWGMMHAFYWHIQGGAFLYKHTLYAMDAKYFNNQNLPFIIGSNDDAFRMAPYYKNASAQSFTEAHVRFTTPYLLIKYLPFFSNKLWCENIHFNYLSSGSVKHYWEAGYSVSQIFFTASAGVYAGFIKGSFQSAGIQFSIDL